MLTPEPSETPTERGASVPLLLAATTLAIVVGLVVSIVPGLQQRAEHGADVFRDHAGYLARVLQGAAPAGPHRLPFGLEAATASSLEYAAGALVLAVALAALGLWYQRLPRPTLALAARVLALPVHVVRSANSGIVGDYLLWLAAGTVLLGGIWALTLR